MTTSGEYFIKTVSIRRMKVNVEGRGMGRMSCFAALKCSGGSSDDDDDVKNCQSILNGLGIPGR